MEETGTDTKESTTKESTTKDSTRDTATGTQAESVTQNSAFPHDPQTDHWDVDFSDSKQVYEGMALPLWLLAGWAMFIIWAVIYLTAGVRTTF